MLYIPKVNDDKVVYATPAIKDAFDAFIAANGLEGYRGQIAPRNGFNSSWWTRADLKATQELPAFNAEHDAEIYLSIMNIGNMLNSDWGVKEQVGFPYVQSVARATINAQGQYVFNQFTAPRAQTIEDRYLCVECCSRYRIPLLIHKVSILKTPAFAGVFFASNWPKTTNLSD
ncbi:MAG: hypothetical protein U5L01_07300 [Rheinheimera sp.]|nr:hypothetical protein [Rheinheimera sp.]